MVLKRYGRASHGVGRRHEAGLYGTSIRRPVASPAAKIWGAEVRRYASTFTNPRRLTSTPALVRFSPTVSATQPTAITASVALALSRLASVQKFIRTPGRCFLEQLDRAEALSHHPRPAECRRDYRCNVLVLGWQDGRAGLEELDPRTKRAENRGDLRASVPGANDQHHISVTSILFLNLTPWHPVRRHVHVSSRREIALLPGVVIHLPRCRQPRDHGRRQVRRVLAHEGSKRLLEVTS